MEFNREPFKNWFGFTRRERRSSLILLLLIVIITGVRYIVPESRMTIANITAMVSDPENPSDASEWDQGSETSSASTDKFAADRHTGQLPENSRKGVLKNNYVKVRSEYSHSEQQQIDLNTCDSVSLVKLPGIGPVLSARIIKYRYLLGGFASVDQLMDVYGLPIETFDLIKGRLFADSTVIKRININSAGFNYKSRIPYLERSEVSAILKYRELKGKISGVSDLVENKLITAEKARKAGPYLKYVE